MQTITRNCAVCQAPFKTLPTSNQTGCRQEHDQRGKLFRKQYSKRRAKGLELKKLIEEHPWLLNKNRGKKRKKPKAPKSG